MKRCSTPYVIKEFQILICNSLMILYTTTTRYYYTPSRVTTIWSTTAPNLERMWSNRNSHSLLVRMQNVTATLKNSLAVSYRIKHTLILPLSSHTPWYLPKRVENYVHTDSCTQMIIGALFIFAKTWKQPRCPSVGKWINKL